jgi:hypothetical protein
MENFDVFYDHLVYFVAICFISWQCDIFNVQLLYNPHFGILYEQKSGNPTERKLAECFGGVPAESGRVRVARWHILQPKNPIWTNFGGSCNVRGWYIL